MADYVRTPGRAGEKQFNGLRVTLQVAKPLTHKVPFWEHEFGGRGPHRGRSWYAEELPVAPSTKEADETNRSRAVSQRIYFCWRMNAVSSGGRGESRARLGCSLLDPKRPNAALRSIVNRL